MNINEALNMEKLTLSFRFLSELNQKCTERYELKYQQMYTIIIIYLNLTPTKDLLLNAFTNI